MIHAHAFSSLNTIKTINLPKNNRIPDKSFPFNVSIKAISTKTGIYYKNFFQLPKNQKSHKKMS